eukprot:2783139-Pyramimonas_sp.AAC.1
MGYSKFYEGILFDVRESRFLAYVTPMPVLKLAFSARGAARVIRLGFHRSGRVLSASYGLPAGCAFAAIA